MTNPDTKQITFFVHADSRRIANSGNPLSGLTENEANMLHLSRKWDSDLLQHLEQMRQYQALHPDYTYADLDAFITPIYQQASMLGIERDLVWYGEVRAWRLMQWAKHQFDPVILATAERWINDIWPAIARAFMRWIGADYVCQQYVLLISQSSDFEKAAYRDSAVYTYCLLRQLPGFGRLEAMIESTLIKQGQSIARKHALRAYAAS